MIGGAILIVDDETKILTRLAEALRHRGLQRHQGVRIS